MHVATLEQNVRALLLHHQHRRQDQVRRLVAVARNARRRIAQDAFRVVVAADGAAGRDGIDAGNVRACERASFKLRTPDVDTGNTVARPTGTNRRTGVDGGHKRGRSIARENQFDTTPAIACIDNPFRNLDKSAAHHTCGCHRCQIEGNADAVSRRGASRIDPAARRASRLRIEGVSVGGRCCSLGNGLNDVAEACGGAAVQNQLACIPSPIGRNSGFRHRRGIRSRPR
ncbi:hypothetical protein D3C86_1266720 [compost metagenome]